MKPLKFKMKSIAASLFFVTGLVAAHSAVAQKERDISKYNLNQPNLNGYDPVSYFPEGGGVPLRGQADIKLDYMGITYFFASEQDLNQFLQNPAKYEPTYGQWCARAMAEGAYVEINPLIFTIHANRLHFFVSKRAKEFFDAHLIEKEASADNFWKQYSGEEPRK